MRFGLIIYDSLDTLTGGYIYDKYLVRYLEQRRHEVDIISLPRRTYLRNLGDNLTGQLSSRTRKKPYAALLQDELAHPSLIRLNRMIRKRTKYPLVTIVHQVLCSQPRSIFINAIYRAIEKCYFASVDAFIFNSQTTRRTVEQWVDLKGCAIVAYPAGDRLGFLDAKDTIPSRAHQKGPLRLLFIGNVLPHKGLHQLLTVLTCISKEKWHLTVVGSLSMASEYTSHIQHLILKYRLTRQVVMTGTRDGLDLKNHLRKSHLLIMPFSYEGFGIVYLEGMAFGLPAIGSTQGAVREFIQHGKNGYLIAPGDSASLRRHIDHLYNNRKALADMGLAALETFHAHPKWADSMETIHTFLNRLVR